MDSATFHVFQEKVGLVPLVIDTKVPNRYSVTLVNPQKHPNVNARAARAFADFITSPRGQQLIQDFGRQKYGESLFTPVNPTSTLTPTSTP